MYWSTCPNHNHGHSFHTCPYVRPSPFFKTALNKTILKWKYWSLLAGLYIWPRGIIDNTCFFLFLGFGSKAFITNFDAISAINAVSSKLDNVTESLEKHGKSMKDAQSELKKVISSLKELLHLGEIRHVAFEIPAGVVIFTRAFLTFQNIAKLYKRRVKIMIATFETVGLSEGIIDDTHVLFYLNFGFLLDTGKQVMLSCPEVCLKVNELQSGLKDFEVLVRDAISQWNRESKSVKQDPHLYMQRQLWVDLINKPKVLRANVEAMTKKAAWFYYSFYHQYKVWFNFAVWTALAQGRRC